MPSGDSAMTTLTCVIFSVGLRVISSMAKYQVYDDNRLNRKFRQGLSDHENAVDEFVNGIVLLSDGYLHLPSYMCTSGTEIASIVSIVCHSSVID